MNGIRTVAGISRITVFGLLAALGLIACSGGGSSGSSGGSSSNWLPPFLVDANGSGVQYAADGQGGGIMTWISKAGANPEIKLARYTGGVISTPSTVSAGGTFSDYWAPIASDAFGNAIIVWGENDGTRTNIWAQRYTATLQTWSKPELIEGASVNARLPNVAMNPDGSAIAVWYEETSANLWTVHANHYTANVGWDGPSFLQSENVNTLGLTLPLAVAMDVQGNGMVSWHQLGSGTSIAWVNRFRAVDKTWVGAAALTTNAYFVASPPQIVMDAAGNAEVVWSGCVSNGSGCAPNVFYSVAAERFTADGSGGGAWGLITQLQQVSTGVSKWPSVRMDGLGNAYVVWEQSDGIRYNAWIARNTQGSWSPAELLETDNSDDAISPYIHTDANGNAFAYWTYIDTSKSYAHTWVKRYTPATGWGAAELFLNDPAKQGVYPNIAMNSDGTAFALWSQYNSSAATRELWARRYIP